MSCALSLGSRIPDHGISPHWAVDVLEVLLAQIGELDPDLTTDVIVGRRRDADATGLCDAFKPRRNIDAVLKDVVRLHNHIADIDAHTESNTPVFQVAGCKFTNAVLELQGRPNRFDSAWKLR